jgi:folate-binding protein YgfZ
MLGDFYKSMGVPMTKAFGVSYPEYFVHPAVEYHSLANFAGVIDLNHWAILRASGNDRASFLHAMLTNDITSLEENQGCHALATTVKGKFVAELFVFAREDDHLIFVSQGDAKETRSLLEKHIITEDVRVDDLSTKFGILAVEGPKAYDCLWRMFPTGPFPKESFRAVARRFENVNIYIMRNGVAGDGGYQMLIPIDEMERIRNYLVQAARGSDGLPVGRLAWNIRRVENGRPWYGIDFSNDNFPHESRLEEMISYSKGCFRGQETLARLKYRGHVNKLLVGLTTAQGDVPDSLNQIAAEFRSDVYNYDEIGVRDRAAPLAKALQLKKTYPPESPLYSVEPAMAGGEEDASKPIGWITTAVFSAKLKGPLFLGYVRQPAAEVGAELILAGPDGRLKVRIVELPVV